LGKGIQHFTGKISTQLRKNSALLRKNSALLRKKLVCTTDIEPTFFWLISQILPYYLLNKNVPGP